MKSIKLIMLGLILGSAGYAQGIYAQGVKFEQNLSLRQILAKAKFEHKSIFIDAFATWCGPCKRMDKEVYTDYQIGAFIDSNFITIKIQMDQTKNDPFEVKEWYADAESLMKKFKVNAFPTYLILNEDGELKYKELGFRDKDQFKTILDNGLNTKLDFSRLTKKFHQNKLTTKDLEYFAIRAKYYSEDSLSNKAADQYIKYLNKQLLTPDLITEHFNFFSNFQNNFKPTDAIVRYVYKNPISTNKATKSPVFSSAMTDNVVSNTYINSFIVNSDKQDKAPDWVAIEKKIVKSFDKNVAKRNILNGKLWWYSKIKDWSNIVKYNIEKSDLLGPDTLGGMAKFNLNNMVFSIIFQHATKTEELKKGVKYMKLILTAEPNNHAWLDTYANLLYKLGNYEESIKMENQALNIAIKEKDENESLYRHTIIKMKAREFTWDQPN